MINVSPLSEMIYNIEISCLNYGFLAFLTYYQIPFSFKIQSTLLRQQRLGTQKITINPNY